MVGFLENVGAVPSIWGWGGASTAERKERLMVRNYRRHCCVWEHHSPVDSKHPGAIYSYILTHNLGLRKGMWEYTYTTPLKGAGHEIFSFKVLYESMSPESQSISLGPLQILSKIRADIREWKFISGVNETGNKRDKFWGNILLNA